MNSEAFFAETGSTERTRILGLLLLMPGALILAMGCCEMSLLKAVMLLVAVFVYASTVIPEVTPAYMSWPDLLQTWLRQLKTKLDRAAYPYINGPAQKFLGQLMQFDTTRP
ncbi:unnamed protein product [Prunus armeniaca]|uniref:Uncharacterized protein n=1 Tax=Prunus armeniaca TaxID=36596 RepID=A0A6J5TET0_PRUAR|nr:unnamed protein product [Prunus armeniaca]